MRARGLCDGHYKRQRKYGDPCGTGALRPRGTPEERFWRKVDKKSGPKSSYRPELGRCWMWKGTITDSGRGDLHYGVLSVGGAGGRLVRAHRFAYELLIGPIPEGAQIDHLCREPLCVNPDHLEPVTNAENTRRGLAAEVNRARQLAKTHCKYGHPLDGRNNRQRYCTTCRRQQQRDRRTRAAQT